MRCPRALAWVAASVYGRLAAVMALVVVSVIAGAGVASADPEQASEGAFATPFDFMNIRDSHGISVWRYMMSIDQGSATKPMAVIWSFWIDALWNIYRGLMAASIWFVGWILQFDWLRMLLSFLQPLGDAMQSLIDQTGLMPLFLAITAFVAGLLMLQGRNATFVYDIVIACAIAAAATGFMSDPVGRIAGESGYITQARDGGLELAASMNRGEGTPEQMIQTMQLEMADVLIRQPTQLINFGRVIDTEGGADCVKEWDAGHQNVEGNDRDTIKDNVAKCGEAGEAMKEYADNPSAMGALTTGFVLWGGLFMVLLCFILGLAVMLAVFYCAFMSVKLIWDMLWGILPGTARGGLWRSVAGVVMALLFIVVSVVFLMTYMQLIRSLFTTTQGQSLLERVIIIGLVELMGVILFWRLWRGFQRQQDGLARAMGKRPGSKPTALPTRQPVNLASKALRTYGAAKVVGHTAAALSTGGGAVAAAGTKVAATRLAKPAAQQQPDRDPASALTPEGTAPVRRLQVVNEGRLELTQGPRALEGPDGGLSSSGPPSAPSSPGGGRAASAAARPRPDIPMVGEGEGSPPPGRGEVPVVAEIVDEPAPRGATRVRAERLPHQAERDQYRNLSSSGGAGMTRKVHSMASAGGRVA
ncbi:hypothetical protein G6031_02785 [Dietzia sp. CQ4]|uniref:hypothetical protein n=1 Tax=Dietzia sp. (strain CQ4) TaxID=370437 RepID=UPI0015FE39E9|nr:hypothetical protein [Dietzia sp. CQ4]MBB1033314.1 hypothetical protein [Dietzia sp. CQ4]